MWFPSVCMQYRALSRGSSHSITHFLWPNTGLVSLHTHAQMNWIPVCVRVLSSDEAALCDLYAHFMFSSSHDVDLGHTVLWCSPPVTRDCCPFVLIMFCRSVKPTSFTISYKDECVYMQQECVVAVVKREGERGSIFGDEYFVSIDIDPPLELPHQ